MEKFLLDVCQRGAIFLADAKHLATRTVSVHRQLKPGDVEMTTLKNLSRRERQIMEIILDMGSATAQDVQDRLESAPSYSAVRALLRILEEKGHLAHRQEGPRYIYVSTASLEDVRRSALDHLLHTLFDGSMEETVATLLDLRDRSISEEELERLHRLIEDARKEGL